MGTIGAMVRPMGDKVDKLLRTEIDELSGLSQPELKSLWPRLMGTIACPRQASVPYLRQALAYRLQQQTHGGLSLSARRALDRLAAEQVRHGSRSNTKRGQSAKRRLPLGTVLHREWHGGIYEVKAVEMGFLYKGKTYGSLSEIARIITGTRWSGPAFFGLRKGKNGP